MNNLSNDNSQSDAGSKRSAPSQNKSSLNSKEQIYNQIKDSHKNINVVVPDLLPPDEDKLNGYDNQSEDNDHRIASKNTDSYSHQQKRNTSREDGGVNKSNAKGSNSKTPNKQTTTSEYIFSPKINQTSQSIDRNVDDLYKWKDRINKKKEVQREFLQQVKESNYNYKVYTNNQSNNIAEHIRPKGRVEDWLMAKGKEKQNKIKQKEIELYGNSPKPKITKKAQNISRPIDIYSRLYEVDKSRRDKSREMRALSEHQRSMSADKGQRKRSKSKETSPDPRMVSKKMNFANLQIQSALNGENESVSSPGTGRVYEQILKEAYSNRSQKGISAISSPPSRSVKSSKGFQQAKDFKELETKKSASEQEKINLYKRLTKPFPSSDTTNGKVLSNRLFFKQNQKVETLSKLQTDLTRADSRDSNPKAKKNTDNSTMNMKNYEAFWDQLLRDDFRQSTPTQELNLNNIGDRQKVWMDRKNKKVDDQKQHLRNKEMRECTFQPVLYSKLSQEFQKNHESLYQKFLERMTSGSNVTKSVPQAKEESRLILPPQSPKMFSPSSGTKNFTSKNAEYNVDMQSRLYNYILDSEKK